MLKESDICFLEDFYTPKRLVEVLFHDFRNLKRYKRGKYGKVRFYQETMLSNEPLIDFELTADYNELDEKESFELRKNISDIYCMGSRGFGKSMIVQIIDMVSDILTDDIGISEIMASCDKIHIDKILQPIKDAFNNHPMLKMYPTSLRSSPDYNFAFKSGHILNSVNFNLNSRSPGDQFVGSHVKKLRIDETSRETDEVYDKRKDAIDTDLGAIQRHTGMMDFTPNTPAGKTFYRLENQKFILNYPQYVSPFWNEKKKFEKIDEYGGENSISYKIYVKGELVEDGVTALDLKRIRDNSYLMTPSGKFKKQIKSFEISKDNYRFFKSLIILDRPENIDKLYLATDVGKRVCEIIIVSQTGKKYEYLYNISLFNLTQQEKEKVIDHIIDKLNINVIAIDCGDGEGRGIFSGLELKISRDKLVYYDGSMKVKVGFEYIEDEETGDKLVKTEKGVPVYKFEYMSEFSVSRLKTLLYSGDFKIPEDHKLDEQLQKVIETKQGGRSIYKCISSQGDHLFDTFKVFFVSEWLKSAFDDSDYKEVDDWGTGATN